MGECNLTIEFDRADATYGIGESVSGQVHIEVTDSGRCDGLRVGIGRRMTLEGGSTLQWSESQALYPGQLGAAERKSFEFSLIAPAPIPSGGGELSIETCVMATAEVPWASVPVTVEPISVVEDKRPDVSVRWDDKKFGRSPPNGGGLATGALVTVAGIGLGVFGFMNSDYDVWLVLGPVIFLFGVIVCFAFGGPWLAQRKLGSVRFSLKRDAAGGYRDAGTRDVLLCSVQVRPGSPVQEVTCSLLVREAVTTHAGSTRKGTRLNTLHEINTTLSAESESGKYSGHIELPDLRQVPSTYASKQYGIHWHLVPRVVVDRCPDWTRKIPLTVTRKVQRDATS